MKEKHPIPQHEKSARHKRHALFSIYKFAGCSVNIFDYKE
jgi:hypothetical protein